MNAIPVHREFSIVLRRDALAAKHLELHAVLAAVGVRAPFSDNAALRTLGPNFGHEAAMALVRRLESMGLAYVGDFFVLAADVPAWCELGVALRASHGSHAG